MQTPSEKKLHPLSLIGIVIFTMGLGYMVMWFISQYQHRPLTDADLPPALKQHYLIGTKPVIGIDLTDNHGKPFTEARFKDHWTFVFFGFTNCPDVCPTTLLVMKQVWSKISADSKAMPSPQMVFVSVDPDRDTQQKLNGYVTYYNPDFIGVRGPHNKLDILVNQLGALYGYEDGTNKDNYTVNHSAQIILIDPQGNMRAVFTPPLTVDDIANTFVQIRKFHRG